VRYWYRVFSITSAVLAIAEIASWITDLIQGRPFHGGWQLMSSIINALIYFYLSRRRTNSN
jgi:uncharacterized membrane protein